MRESLRTRTFDQTPNWTTLIHIEQCKNITVVITKMLTGSPVLPEAKERRKALEEQWQQLQDQFFSKDPAKFPAGAYGCLSCSC